MSEFLNRFRARVVERDTTDEAILQAAVAMKKINYANELATQDRTRRLRLVVASQMRIDAYEIVPEIPQDVEPSFLVITNSQIVPVSPDKLTPKERQANITSRTEVVTTVIDRQPAFIISSGYQRTINSVPPRMIFAPILVGAIDRQLWIAPKHEILDTGINTATPESIERKRASYKYDMRGMDIVGNAERHRINIDSNSPRLATDDDLVPQGTAIAQLEGEISLMRADFQGKLLTLAEAIRTV